MILEFLVDQSISHRQPPPRWRHWIYRAAVAWAHVLDARDRVREWSERFEQRIDEADAELFIARLDRIGNAVLCGLILLFAVWLLYNIVLHVPVPSMKEGMMQ